MTVAGGTLSLANVTVDNVAAGATVNKGDIATLSGNVANLDGMGFTVTVTWGANQTNSDTIAYPAGTTSFTVTHQYVDDGSNPFAGAYDIGVSVTSSDNRTFSSTSAATITGVDVAPTVNITGEPGEIQAYSPVKVSAVLADPGENGAFTYSWTAATTTGDNDQQTGTSASFTFDPHESAGYTVKLTATDADGKSVNDNIVIPGPSGGTITAFQPDEPNVTIEECDEEGDPTAAPVEAGSPAYFLVSVSSENMPDHGTVDVYYTTEDGTDHAGTDYTPTDGDKEMTFSYDSSANGGQGGYDPQTITVPTSPTANNGNFWVDITRLEDPDANIPGSSYPASNESPPLGSAKATIVHPDLIAETVDTSSIGLMAKLDSTGLATGNLLPHGDEAYVPLSNESQVYGQEAHGQQTDANYSRTIPNDKFLLPVKVTGLAEGTYNLSVSGGIRVWGAADRTEPKTSVTVGSKGTTMVFVEGIQAGQWQLILGDNLDTLTVNVFTFNGPQDVPNYSTYSYSITGVRSVFSENPWSIPTDGTIAGLSSQASYNDTVGVHWGQGGANGFGQISYAIDEYYTWSYYVNVVQIGISNAAGKQSAIEVTGSISQPPGTGAATAQGRFIWNGVSCISLVSPEIKIAAGISMEGPNTNWGVFQMVVGNVQLMEQPDVTATYFDPNDANGGTNTLKLTFPEQTIDQRIWGKYLLVSGVWRAVPG